MKAQEKSDKARIKLKFATALNKLLDASPLTSFKGLAKEAGMEPSHIQKISRGELDVTLTTAVAISNALGITYSELAITYDSITDDEIEGYLEILEKRKQNRGKAKLPIEKNIPKKKSKRK